MERKINVIIVVALALSISGIGYLTVDAKENQKNRIENINYQFSFEENMSGWHKNGTDLDNPPVEWSIERSQKLSKDGETSLDFSLSNVNDAGKIWIIKSFDVDSENFYKVNLSYDFASSTYGDFNLWRIIAGSASKPPSVSKNLTFQEDAGNGLNEDNGYIWLKKNYNFITRSSPDGEIFVYLGVWGTWETDRTYYIDNIHVNLEKVNMDNYVTEAESREIARKFVKNSPTYQFDGSKLEYKETLYPETYNKPFCWTFLYEFESTHSGYGDRTGDNLLQIITKHEAHITVDNGKVVRAVLDGKWDMLKQKKITESEHPKPEK